MHGLGIQSGQAGHEFERLVFQVSADPFTDSLDERFQRLGTGRRETAKHGPFVVDDIDPSKKSMWKWTLRFKALLQRWISVTAPVLTVARVQPACWMRWVSMARYTMPQRPAHDLGPAREQESELEGEAQHPLA